MNKKSLIKSLYEQTDLSYNDINVIINNIIKTFRNALLHNERITLIGLGSFSVVKRNKCRKMNPRTKKYMNIEEHNVIKFFPSKCLKNKINVVNM